MNVRHSGRDVLAELELICAFEDFDGAQLTGPIVDVLKQMTMDSAKVGEIKRPGGNAAPTSLDRIAAFDLVQNSWIGNSKAISKSSCAWIDVGIVVLGHFAAARAFASI